MVGSRMRCYGLFTLFSVCLLVAGFLSASSTHPLSRFRHRRFLKKTNWEVGEDMEREVNLLERNLEDDRREDEQMRKMEAYLEQYGYLMERKSKLEHYDERSSEERTQAIKNFQSMNQLSPTGTLDNQTMTAMARPRCGMKDMIPEEIKSNTRYMENTTMLKAENFFVPGYKWRKNHLTWKLHNFYQSNQLTPDIQRRAIGRALRLWSDATNIDFSETMDERGDINIKFAYGLHDDGTNNIFDGPVRVVNGVYQGKVLGHAFYPESGEVHFDESESWTDGTRDGVNMLIVAAHELGHSLGLGHSKVQGALMFPNYQGYVADYTLPDDDMMAIQSLYGKREGPAQPNRPAPAPTSRTGGGQSRQTQPPPTRPQPQPGTAPDTCSVPFKAATETHDGRVYIYNDQWMWRMSDYGLDDEFPTLVKSYYENPPDRINAVIFTSKHMYTYIFSGNQLYIYYGFQLVRHMTMKSSGYPTSPQAAITASDGTVYLIKNRRCWAFDEMAMDIQAGTSARACSTVFPGAPTRFDTVVRITDQPGYLFFFHGPIYYKYSEADRHILPGYPKQKAGPWMGPACNADPFTPK